MNAEPNPIDKTPASDAMRCAVRDTENAEQQAALDRRLAAHTEWHVQRFAPKDDDALNDALSVGRFDLALFADLDALLTTVWKGYGDLDRWWAAGVKIVLADPPDDAAWLEHAMATLASYRQYGARRRRREIIAAIALSICALLALAALFYSVSPPETVP